MTETHTGKQSRNGKKPVEVAKGVQVSISGQDITAKGAEHAKQMGFRHILYLV